MRNQEWETMAKPISEEDLAAILQAVRSHQGGASLREIANALSPAPAMRTLQYRLKYLVDTGDLVKEGEGRWAKYSLPTAPEATAAPQPPSPAPHTTQASPHSPPTHHLPP